MHVDPKVDPKLRNYIQFLDSHRCVDFGIAEQHAVTFAAGLATEGPPYTNAPLIWKLMMDLFRILYLVLDVSLSVDVASLVQFRRTSLTGFPAQSIRSSNAIALDSPYLLVLITGTSQSRQHVDTSLIHIEPLQSPTKSLFDVGSSMISIVIVNTKEYHSDVLAES
ncbi:reverse transcriptase domain-containing protein [Tanacetum coccineum]